MVNKRYYWLKLQETFFTDKRIKRLRKIAGGDTYTIIYLKLLLLSLQDEGKLFFENVENSFIEELALELDEEDDDVQVTINYLAQKGMLEIISDDEYFLTELPSMIGSETASTRRSRLSRSKNKDTILLENKNKALQCNTNATLKQQNCNGELELYKELDVELELKDKVIHNYLKKLNLSTEQIKDTIKVLNDIGKGKEYLQEKVKLMDSRGKEVRSNFGYLLKAIKEDWKIQPNTTTNNYKTKFHNFEQSTSDKYSEAYLSKLVNDGRNLKR